MSLVLCALVLFIGQDLPGFDDSLIYKEIALPEADRSIPFLNEKEDTAGEEFSLWKENKDKTVY